jgi:hypothetical protein
VCKSPSGYEDEGANEGPLAAWERPHARHAADPPAHRDGEYLLTAAGEELLPIVESMSVWGQRWARGAFRDSPRAAPARQAGRRLLRVERTARPHRLATRPDPVVAATPDNSDRPLPACARNTRWLSTAPQGNRPPTTSSGTGRDCTDTGGESGVVRRQRAPAARTRPLAGRSPGRTWRPSPRRSPPRAAAPGAAGACLPYGAINEKSGLARYIGERFGAASPMEASGSMVELRDATQADAHGIATVLVRSWRAAYRGLLPDEVLAGLSIPEREQFWSDVLTARPPHTRTVVATIAGAIVGRSAARTRRPRRPHPRRPLRALPRPRPMAPRHRHPAPRRRPRPAPIQRLHPRRPVDSRHLRTRPALLLSPRLDRHRTFPTRPRTRQHRATRTTTPPRPESLNRPGISGHGRVLGSQPI